MYHLRKNRSPKETQELYSFASRPNFVTKSYSTCVVNWVKFVAHSQDSRRTTQNSCISVLGIVGNTFYGILEKKS